MAPAFRTREFRLLWAGQSISAVGDAISVVALAALVVESGHGATGIGVVLAARVLATVLFILAGGVLGDRLRRTTVMRSADAMRAVAIAAIALMPHDVPLPVLAALTFVVGMGEAFFEPSYLALVPSIVPGEHLESANGASAISRQFSRVAGPAIAGVVIAVAGARAALWIDAASFAVSLATLTAVREPAAAPRPAHASIRADVSEGLAAVRGRPWIGLVIAMATLQLLFVIAPWQVLLPAIAAADLGGPGTYGLVLSCMGAGTVVGALVATRWRPRLPGLTGLLALLPFAGALAALAVGAPLPVIAAVTCVGGVGESIFGVFWISCVQRDVPADLLARVFSLDYLGSIALQPVGLALAGPAAHAFGAGAVLLFGAGVLIVTTLPLLTVPSVRRFASDHVPDERDRPATPEPAAAS